MELGRRIAVVGTSGSGKTRLAQQLATRLGVPHIELDAFQHGPNWQQATEEELRQRAAAAVAGDGWVCDGNYSAVRDLVWGRADTLVWLDYRRAVVMWRVVRRSVRRAVTREPMWNGNRERWRRWADPDHPIRWAWSTHAGRRREFGAATAAPEYSHLRVLRFRRPREVAGLFEV